jgi:hypothetical protein
MQGPFHGVDTHRCCLSGLDFGSGLIYPCPMDVNLDLLTKIQEQIIECRRTACETPDSKLALFLYRLADEVEAEAREADLIGT